MKAARFETKPATRIGAKWGGGNNVRSILVTNALDAEGERIAYREGRRGVWRSNSGAPLDEKVVRELDKQLVAFQQQEEGK